MRIVNAQATGKKKSQPAGSGQSKGGGTEGWAHPDSVTKCPMEGAMARVRLACSKV